MKKSKCEALTSGTITDCDYHSKNGTTIKCQQCKSGKKSSSAARTDCTGTVATNALVYRMSESNVWECAKNWVVNWADQSACVAWATTNDQNCRMSNTWKMKDTDTMTPCVGCKDGYYFAGSHCIKGTSNATSGSGTGTGTGTTGTGTGTTTGTSTKSTTTKASGFLNIFATGITLAIAVAFN